MKPIAKFIMTAFAATALIPAIGMAQIPDTRAQGYLQGYLVDHNGKVVMSATGDCWRHHDSDSPNVVGPCNPPYQPAAAAAPAPRPAVVAVPPLAAPVATPVSQKISFSGDALFAFDKSVLKPEGKAMLDRLVLQLDGATTYDTIHATGHTDRFGSTEYNQKLSVRRAHTVKDYLVSKNVQAGRIDAEGKGEMQPITKADECRGAATTKVIACLQPDRRVDVEMTGTKTILGSR